MKTRLLLVLFFPLLIHAQISEPAFTSDPAPVKSFSFLSDQDFLTPYNEDRNYTMGMGLIFSHSEICESNYWVIPFMRKGLDWVFGISHLIKHNPSSYSSSLSLMGSGFTPLDLEAVDPIPDDRPYGSITVLGSDRVVVFNAETTLEEENGNDSEPNEAIAGMSPSHAPVSRGKNPEFAISTGLQIGFLGLHAADFVQSHIHENHWFGSTRPVPLGWDNQISNGGEPTALYSLSIMAPISTVYQPDNPQVKVFESILEAGTQLGYYTNFQLGLTNKLGVFDEAFWTNLSRTNAVSQAASLAGRRVKAYVYASVRTRFVMYNALLQGQFRKSAFTLSGAEVSPIIFEGELGISLNLFDRVLILYKPLVLRTGEMKGMERDHIWGNVAISYLFK